MIRQSSGGKAKWKKGLQKLRRQSTVSEFSAGDQQTSHSLMDEEGTEDEMQDYLSKLKKKTGLNQLWSGRKFEEAIDKDPDIDLSEEPRLRTGTLKELTLDSDEEDLKKFINNLTDEEYDVLSEHEEPSQTASSKSDFNLMKNINFAEASKSAYGMLKVDTDDEKDYIPVIMKPDLDESESKNESSGQLSKSSRSDIFRNANINFISSEVSSLQQPVKRNKDGVDGTAESDRDGEDTELSEEIPEMHDTSRVNTPLNKSNDYTASKFESYSSEESSVASHKETPRKGAKETKTNKESKDLSSRTLSSQSSSISHNSRSENRNVKKKRSKDFSETDSHSQSSSVTSSSSTSNSTSSSSSSSKTKTSRSSKLSRSEKRHTKNKIKSRGRDDKKKPHHMHSGQLTIGLHDLGMDESILKNLGALKYSDPSPVAATVVSEEALDAVAAYNPTVLALNDLLKYQLQLTRQHIDNSWRLYRAYAEPDAVGKHRYTTLKQTLKYMKKHAPSVVSYQDALKQVQNGDDF
eukprot:gene2374-18017_t